jgi:hypothetical protein
MELPSEAEGPRPWLKRHPEIWASVVLFIASNLFVFTFAKFVKWETGHSTTVPDFCTWDCNWFRFVVEQGYDLEPNRQEQQNHANWSFYPLFPVSALPFRHFFHFSAGTSLVLASKCELFGAILFFLLLLGGELQETREYLMAGSLVAFNPYVIYAHAGYSEPLYFALACLGFYFLQRRRWLPSGITGALLSATRIVGCMFAVSYLVVWLKDSEWYRVLRPRSALVLVGLLLCPLGMALYAFYLYHHTGDALGFIHIQVAWGRIPGSPWRIIIKALRDHQWQRFWGIMILAGLAVVGWLFKLRRPELAIFLLGAILIPLSADTWGFARYLWWQPPLLYAIFIFLKRYRAWWPVYFAFSAGMASFMIIEWFSGSRIVV